MRISAIKRLALSLILMLGAEQASAQNDGNRNPNNPGNDRAGNPGGPPPPGADDVSPVRRILRDQAGGAEPEPLAGIRSIDGGGNNLQQPQTNTAGVPLKRLIEPQYADQVSALAGTQRPNPRTISNTVASQDESIVNSSEATDFLWQWGQFLDHDIDLTDGADPEEPASIAIPTGDAWFDPDSLGNNEMPFNRSLYDPGSGVSVENPRQQLNEITGWIDASNVYGSDFNRASALRANDGSGRLATSPGGLLPYNTEGFANAGGTSDSLFLAGDVRANEQVGLTAMHTLFVREHNRLADRFRANNPELSGDEIYQRARANVAAIMQVITYREFLPLLLGDENLPPYSGYQPEMDASIFNSFSTAAYRFGHSLLSSNLLRLDENFEEISAGNLPLRSAFFSPGEIESEGIEPILRGLSAQLCQELDVFVVDDIRNFLFGDPDNNGFDLASLNIQRGRDHGLPSYTEARTALGLEPIASFEDISSNPEVVTRLSDAYDSVEDIDLWIGGLAEDHLPGAMLGEVFATIVKQQFIALRDGDRFWYTRQFSGSRLRRLERTTLADVIRRNTGIGGELPQDVFRLAQ